MKKFHTFKPQSFELLTGLRSFLAVTLMIVMALGNVKAGEITHVFTETSGSINEQISFTTAKNSSQNAPAVYSSQLRVYYAPNGNGGSCTLEIADGYVITGLTIFARSSYTPTCNYSVDGGGNETATLLGTQYTISDIYATESLTFQNGNTVNRQLRVDSIKITYKQICYTPTGLQVSNVGSTDASLRWIKGGTETNWQMNLNGNVSDLTGAFVDNDTVTYNLSGLNIHAPYQVAVNAACAPDNLSSWSDTVDFTTICPVYSTTLSDVSICEGDVFPFHGQNITVTGDYEALLTSSTDCDSTLYLHVEVIPIPVYTLPIQTICEGESYLFGGEELTTAGTYRDTISTLHCDSIVILTLEVLPYALLNVTEYICEGESFTFDGVDLTVGGNYTQTLTGGAANGCDSVTNLTLIVKPVPVENIDVSICEGSGYDFNGDILTTAGDYHDTLVAANGCDSIVNLTLTVNPVYRRVDTLLLFADDLQGYSVGLNEYNGYSQFGCDSITQIMVYGISCAENYDATAQYGEQEVVLEDIAGPVITPFSPDIRTSLSRAAIIRVGETEQLTWHIILSDDTVNCTQNIHVAYPPCGSDYTATDGDGHIYPTIRIGANCWLRKNLSSQHYVQDGRAVAKAGIYRSDMMPDTTSNLENFGRLYSWYSAIGIRENSNDIPISTPNGEIQGICPNGWHIPNMAELSSLNCCSAIALKNNILWIGEATNESNFSALPAGLFNSVKDRYEYIRSHTFLWSSESDSPLSACTAALTYYCDQSLILNQRSKNDRCSVRCVKN